MVFLILKREKTLVNSTHIFGSLTTIQAEADRAMDALNFVVELTDLDLNKILEGRLEPKTA